MRFISLLLYYLGHLSYLLCDYCGMTFMCRPYQWCMSKSIDFDTGHKVWSEPEVKDV